MAVIFDTVELLAVFLLAVEAIKVENLSVLVGGYLRPLISRLNPRITFVDDDSHLSFFERNMVNFFLLGFYVLGFAIIFSAFNVYNIDVIGFLRESAPVYWVLSILGLLIVPFIAGFFPYQLIVWFLEYSVKFLTWVQLRTHTGAVGILGFALFALQFLGRRIWIS
ncbi:hypothetical protein [Shewanella sp. 10N.286.48.B5]|uniref:hypothetical protein n=1 Tax=Shewanella sp. 10N.286.48.B5 TaxID=1880834 RepID=UPI000CB7A124|nr:hypothetical protein [Shewanella sp. 10N.286.48.B5]PMH88193.1 hypothetical protein BCU57_20055 [Shewanella sp. 10N.286.48.B5]